VPRAFVCIDISTNQGRDTWGSARPLVRGGPAQEGGVSAVQDPGRAPGRFRGGARGRDALPHAADRRGQAAPDLMVIDGGRASSARHSMRRAPRGASSCRSRASRSATKRSSCRAAPSRSCCRDAARRSSCCSAPATRRTASRSATAATAAPGAPSRRSCSRYRASGRAGRRALLERFRLARRRERRRRRPRSHRCPDSRASWRSAFWIDYVPVCELPWSLECSGCGATRSADGLPGVCACGQPYLVRYRATPALEARAPAAEA